MSAATFDLRDVKGAERYPSDAAGMGRIRGILFCSPAILLLIIFALFPAIWTIVLGTTDYELTGVAAANMRFVGAANFTDALKDPSFYNAMWLSIVFVFCSGILGQSLLGFAIAWYLQTIPKSIATILEALVVIAWVIPASVNTFIWFSMYQGDGGTINMLLGTDTVWLVKYPMLCIIVFNIWVGVAFSVLQYRSALVSVPKNEMESASLLGANRWRCIQDVVIPHIKGTIFSNLLLVVLSTFNTFTPYMLTMGGPNGQSDIMPAYIYNTALGNGELGRGSAISAFLLLVNLVFFLILQQVRRRG